jgi:hypothetical protein
MEAARENESRVRTLENESQLKLKESEESGARKLREAEQSEARKRAEAIAAHAAALKVAEDRASGLQAQLKEVKAAVEVAQRVLREQVGQRSHSRRRVAVQHDSKP